MLKKLNVHSVCKQFNKFNKIEWQRTILDSISFSPSNTVHSSSTKNGSLITHLVKIYRSDHQVPIITNVKFQLWSKAEKELTIQHSNTQKRVELLLQSHRDQMKHPLPPMHPSVGHYCTYGKMLTENKWLQKCGNRGGGGGERKEIKNSQT